MNKYLRWVTSGLLACLIMVMPALAISTFSDVDKGAEYAEAVEYLSDTGLMVGDEQGNFNPNKTVTRAEMAAIVCRMLGEAENLTVSTQFADVPESHWANTYVSKAAELGIVNGYDNGNFGPSDAVTYEQALTMIVRAMGLAEIAEKNGGYPNGYIFVADDYGYNRQVSAQTGELLKRWQVAIIIYNCME